MIANITGAFGEWQNKGLVVQSYHFFKKTLLREPALVKILTVLDANRPVHPLEEDPMEDHAYISSTLEGLQNSMENICSVAMTLHPSPSKESLTKSTLIKEETLLLDHAAMKPNTNQRDLDIPDNPDSVAADLEPDILENEVKWALESLANKRPVEVMAVQLNYLKS